jgi:hypothetical protein
LCSSGTYYATGRFRPADTMAAPREVDEDNPPFTPLSISRLANPYAPSLKVSLTAADSGGRQLPIGFVSGNLSMVLATVS